MDTKLALRRRLPRRQRLASVHLVRQNRLSLYLRARWHPRAPAIAAPIDLCVPGGPLCTPGGNNNMGHGMYAVDGLTEQAADFAARHL